MRENVKIITTPISENPDVQLYVDYTANQQTFLWGILVGLIFLMYALV